MSVTPILSLVLILTHHFSRIFSSILHSAKVQFLTNYYNRAFPIFFVRYESVSAVRKSILFLFTIIVKKYLNHCLFLCNSPLFSLLCATSLFIYRFMVQAVFKRNVRDPTSYNPPRFVVAGRYSIMPKKEEIEATMSRAAFLLAKVH